MGARAEGFLEVSDTLLVIGSLDAEVAVVALSTVGIKCGGIVADLVVVNPAVRRRSLAFIRPPRLPDPSCSSYTDKSLCVGLVENTDDPSWCAPESLANEGEL
jgi:hypothetical protein